MFTSDCYLTFLIEDARQSEASEYFLDMWRFLDEFDRTLSRFRLDSELSQLNQQAGTRITISPLLHRFLSDSIAYASMTQGLITPFVLPDLQRTGYKGSWPDVERVPKKLDMTKRQTVPIDQLQLSDDDAMIPADTALDSGGIGKGMALDMLADIIEARHISNYCFSLGGDIVCRGVDLTGEPWQVHVATLDESNDLPLSLRGTSEARWGIATSGITKRRGKGWHHIIDPRTGTSSTTPLATVTVGARSATLADVLAKVALIDEDLFESFLHQDESIDYIPQYNEPTRSFA